MCAATLQNGGGWLQVGLLAGDRAVMLGADCDRSRSVAADAVDLLTGLPDWVADAARTRDDGQGEDWLGFVLWWEDGAWWSIEHPVDDGAAHVPLLQSFPEAVRRLVAAGSAVDERLLLDALIFEELHLAHAVVVARAAGMIYPARTALEARGMADGTEC